MSRQCQVCSLSFIDEYSFHGHLEGKKHKKNLDLEKERKSKEQNSIYVSPIPHWATPDEIIKFFTDFGKIHYTKFGPRYVIIEYTAKEPVEFLLNNPVYMNKWLLKIRRRIVDNPHKNFPNKHDQSTSSEEANLNDIKEESELLDTTIYQLEEKTTFNDQLEKLLSLVQADDNEVRARCDNVCKSLDRVLRTAFPQCRAIRFGSTVTGLHLKGSDVDIFLDIGEPIREDEDSPTENNGNDNRQVWTPRLIFKEVKSILFKNKNIFTQVIPIPMAKIPVIKFNHIPTNTDCDISFKNSLGVHNSQLIKHLLTLDPRIKPLIIIIKYWAKRLDISGTGKITNYSLVIAIIFYLQQPNLQILPTVKKIQSSCEPKFFNGWQINFDKEFKNDIVNQASIPELLYGFFKFYAELTFNSVIISPLDGLIHHRIDYPKVAEMLGINIDNLYLNRPACILDPIKLDHNIASGWSDRLLPDFQANCIESAHVCEQAAKDKYDNLLVSLYDPTIKKQTKKIRKFYMAIAAGKFERFGIPDDIDNRSDIEDKQKYIEDHWFLMIYKLLEKIFKKVFKFDVQIVYNMINIKQIKTEEQSDVHTKKNDTIILLCIGNYCLNRGRKNIIPNLDVSLSCIERESLISDRILETLQEKKETSTIKFKCSIAKRMNPLRTEITLTDVQFKNKAFVEIASYMTSKIPKIIDKELIHMAQFNKNM